MVRHFSPQVRAALSREALRLNLRFIHEVVEAHNFCPWSKPARSAQEVHREVWLEPLDPATELLSQALIQRIARIAMEEQHKVTLMIFPLARLDPKEWRRFVARVREQVLEAPDKTRTLACAPFHPNMPYSLQTPASAVPLFRRSPDPTVQFVRLDVLHGLSRNRKERYVTPQEAQKLLSMPWKPSSLSPSERVARDNLQTVRGLPLEKLLQTLRELQQDRLDTYENLGVKFPVLSAYFSSLKPTVV